MAKERKADLAPHGNMSSDGISTSYSLDGLWRKQRWQLGTEDLGLIFYVRQQVQIRTMLSGRYVGR